MDVYVKLCYCRFVKARSLNPYVFEMNSTRRNMNQIPSESLFLVKTPDGKKLCASL